MEITIGRVVAIKPDLIRVECSLDTNDITQYEITLHTPEFTVFVDDGQQLQVQVDMNMFQQVVTNEVMNLLQTGFIAKVLQDNTPTWEVVQTQDQTNEPEMKDGKTLAYGEETVDGGE